MSFSEEFVKFRTPKQIAGDALRAELRLRLSECTAEQQAFFHKLYPETIDKLSQIQLGNAISLCHRTLVKNRAGRVAAI